MSNRRKAHRPRGTGDGLRLVAGQGTGGTPGRGKLHAVGSQAAIAGARVARPALPDMPETAASCIHIVAASLHGAIPPLWRRLELPSAITLDGLHEVLQLTFDWSGFGPHSFQTPFGEFGGQAHPTSQAARRAAERSDGSAVALAQAAGGEADGGGDHSPALTPQALMVPDYERCSA